ncbi:MAG TPA: DUF2934 domain-containing protein [Rhizomicrobium sp.]|jgi:hypothetical protein|nr:DUF2934 domain-containing protein [Rhizomicrobium sp.]
MAAEHEIRTRSYLLWEAEGRPQGRDMEFWFRAKIQLEEESRAASPWKRPRLYIVPCASVSSPPRKLIANRVPSATRTGSTIAATR